MARSLLPFVQNGYYASRNWIPLVKGNGFTTSGGGEQEEVWETASGPIVTFDAVAAPLRQLSVAVEPVQNLNGYDHPWPAGGGKNLIDIQDINFTISASTVGDHKVYLEAGTYYAYRFSDITTFNSKAQYSTDGTTWTEMDTDSTGPIAYADSTMQFYRCKLKLTVVTPCWITFFAQGSESHKVTMMLTTDSTYYTSVKNNFIATDSFQGGTYYSVLFSPYSNICPITGWDSVKIWVQPTHDTTAEPTATIQLGQTVYGGTLDVVTGVVTVDHKKRTFNGTVDTWRTTSGYVNRFVTTDVSMAASGNYSTFRSNYLKTSAWGTNPFTFGLRTDGTLFLTLDPNAEQMTDEQFNAYLSATPLEILYELAEPLTIQLTPQQISTLQGTNNVWSDAGDVTVEYRAQ